MPYYLNLIFNIAFLVFLSFFMGSDPHMEARYQRAVDFVEKIRVKNKKLTNWIFFKTSVPTKKTLHSKYWITWPELIAFVLELVLFVVLIPSYIVYWCTQNLFLNVIFHSIGYSIFTVVLHGILFFNYAIFNIIGTLKNG